jgi:hypothetical protein
MRVKDALINRKKNEDLAENQCNSPDLNHWVVEESQDRQAHECTDSLKLQKRTMRKPIYTSDGKLDTELAWWSSQQYV